MEFVVVAISRSGVVEPYPLMIESFDHGVEVPMPTLTDAAPVPPKTIEFDAPTVAKKPIAVIFVSAVVDATAGSREDHAPRKAALVSMTDILSKLVPVAIPTPALYPIPILLDPVVL